MEQGTEMKFNRRFNNNIEKVCRLRGITIEDLAKNMETPKRGLDGIANGEKALTIYTARRIASHLDVHIDELFPEY